ncbi:hypothetical protein ACFOUP_06965 [Belliella kenyensis]|uniref:YD repeat-containing protein n=1 Tax=Belliella kenyensis TaxID=1472724 RepID=A0ABV8EJN4_9BACT|nr:hypothetical protein [Belliella kenyensis]MCH7403894.1 hypothetical protein [Belliella kenyensis]MDN3604906.1 hypothetical protein [Belliella kenyensis]
MGITGFTYNPLNLPSKVTFSASKYIEYTYDASGSKLSQKSVDGGTTKISDYVGGFVYENNKLQFLQHNEAGKPLRNSPVDCFRLKPGCGKE